MTYNKNILLARDIYLIFSFVFFTHPLIFVVYLINKCSTFLKGANLVEMTSQLRIVFEKKK